MSTPPDELESELGSLRPRQPSERVRRGIAHRLAEPPPRVVTRALWAWSGAALALAASVVIAVSLWPRAENAPNVRRNPIVAGSNPMKPDELPPTLLAYYQVFRESDEKLDTLLDRHGAILLTAGNGAADSGSLWKEMLN